MAIVIATNKAATKADKAREIFNDCYKDGVEKAPQRKVILERMQKEAGLTAAGSATYLQNFKKAAGIVNLKSTAAPTA